MGGIYLKILEEAGTTLCETAEPGFYKLLTCIVFLQYLVSIIIVVFAANS